MPFNVISSKEEHLDIILILEKLQNQTFCNITAKILDLRKQKHYATFSFNLGNAFFIPFFFVMPRSKSNSNNSLTNQTPPCKAPNIPKSSSMALICRIKEIVWKVKR